MDCVVNQLDRVIYGITSKDQLWFKKKLSIPMVEFDAWSQEIGDQELRKSIKQRGIPLYIE